MRSWAGFRRHEPPTAVGKLGSIGEKIYNGVHTGVIATGDRFVADPAFCLQLKAELGAISCEMETGAVAQVLSLIHIF